MILKLKRRSCYTETNYQAKKNKIPGISGYIFGEAKKNELYKAIDIVMIGKKFKPVMIDRIY